MKKIDRPSQATRPGYLDDPLWEKLLQLPLENEMQRRLARENGWGASFTAEVLLEYRRFLYLTQRAQHAVTPSKHVDQAWHLHLIYTRSYWERLCENTLGTPLHHEPGSGALDETSHFAYQYQRTRESYRSVFGQEPPETVWGPAQREGATRTEPTRWRSRRWLGWLATGLGSGAIAGAKSESIAGAVIAAMVLGGTGASLWFLSRFRTGAMTGGGSCGGIFIASSGGGATDTSGDGCGGDGGCGDGASGCGSSCGGGGCGGGGCGS